MIEECHWLINIDCSSKTRLKRDKSFDISGVICLWLVIPKYSTSKYSKHFCLSTRVLKISILFTRKIFHFFYFCSLSNFVVLYKSEQVKIISLIKINFFMLLKRKFFDKKRLLIALRLYNTCRSLLFSIWINLTF